MNRLSETFRCFLVDRDSNTGEVRSTIQDLHQNQLPAGDVMIRVEWSSLNYKDALAVQANPGVVRQLPHVPGIDAAGTVVASNDNRYQVGQAVIVTGYELGAPRWGGWSERIRVPAEWVVPLPKGLSLREAMILGTAGFTAAQCVRDLLRFDLKPDSGPMAVTGATGAPAGAAATAAGPAAGAASPAAGGGR